MAELKFKTKGKTFTIPSTYTEGYLPYSGEALALNTLITRRLREKILAGEIKTRTEAERFVNSDQAFGLPDTFEELESLEDLEENLL